MLLSTEAEDGITWFATKLHYDRIGVAHEKSNGKEPTGLLRSQEKEQLRCCL